MCDDIIKEDCNQLAKIYLKLYKGCIDYKKNNNKDIDCENYYNVYMVFSSKNNQYNLNLNDNKSNK